MKWRLQNTFALTDSSAAQKTDYSASVNIKSAFGPRKVLLKMVDANASVTTMKIIIQHSPSGFDITDANAEWIEVTAYTFNAADLTALEKNVDLPDRTWERTRIGLQHDGADGTTDTVDLWLQ